MQKNERLTDALGYSRFFLNKYVKRFLNIPIFGDNKKVFELY